MTHPLAMLGRLMPRAFNAVSRHPDAAALAVIILVALTLRLVFTWWTPTFIVRDSVAYYQSGYEWARGYGFDLTFKRTPLYPMFIAGVVAFVGEDLQVLAIVQHLVGVVTCVLTYWLGRLLFGRTAGLVAGLLVALSGQLIIYEHYILAEAIFVPLLVSFGLALLLAVRRSSLRLLFLAGLLLGLAGLARPVGQAVLAVVPFALLVATWPNPFRTRAHSSDDQPSAPTPFHSWSRTEYVPAGLRPFLPAALASLVVAVGFAGATLPWLLRNWVVNGSLESAGSLGQNLVGRITRHDEGFTLPDPSSPSPYDDPVRTEARALVLRQMGRDARPSAINHRLRNTFGWTEAQANRLMRDVCLEILWSQRDYYLTSTITKWRRLLWGTRGTDEDFLGDHWGRRKSDELSEEWTSNATIAHLLPPPTPLQETHKHQVAAAVEILSPGNPPIRWTLFGFFLVGLAGGLLRRTTRWWTCFSLLLLLALTLPAVALVGPVPRYRYPVDPFLAVLIGGGLACLASLAHRVVQARQPRTLHRVTDVQASGSFGT